MLNFTNEIKEIETLLKTPGLSEAAWREANEVYRLLSNIPDAEDLTGPLGRLLDDHDEGIQISENARKLFEEIYQEILHSEDKTTLEREVEWAKFSAASEDLAFMEENPEDVAAEFSLAFGTDSEMDFDKITEMYTLANESEKRIIDAVFVHLCGWSLPTLSEQAREEG